MILDWLFAIVKAVLAIIFIVGIMWLLLVTPPPQMKVGPKVKLPPTDEILEGQVVQHPNSIDVSAKEALDRWEFAAVLATKRSLTANITDTSEAQHGLR